MKIENRPYAGNWTSDIKNKYRRVRSWTPDVIVQFNGDTAVPGCNQCKNRIDFQAFITSVSVAAGIGTNSNSCSIEVVIPQAYGDSVFKDGEFLLEPGVEVNVFYRGFFKTDNLANDQVDVDGEGVDLSKVEMRPYYPVFHGVLSSVGVSPTLQGSYSVSLSCRSLLSFWENQHINTNAGYFAAQPTESRGGIQLTGHKYSEMTPHQIIYDLYLDSGGSAQGTGFALQSMDNIKTKAVTGQQFFSLALRYWENRFENGLYGLRMYGVSGRLYSATETALLSDVSIKGKKNEFNSVLKEALAPNAHTKPSPILRRFMEAGLIKYDDQGRILRTASLQFLAQAAEDDQGGGVNVRSLKEFVTDIGALGQVSFFESNFDTKLGLASTVAQKCGYEFFQDFDGNLVFKPPMYNLDTSDNRVYRIQREDIISISFDNAEPEATYIECKGGPFRNLKGVIDSGEWGVKSTYVDYRLVAKYGWKGTSLDTSFYNTKRQAYYAAVVELDRLNRACNTASCTITQRPEMRPGYPVYIEHIDCYYYVETISHSFSYGGSAQTTLTLTNRRKKFIPPGDADVDYSEDPARAVDLGRTDLPKKYIYKKVTLNNDLGDSYEQRKIAGFPNVVMALDPTKMDLGYLTFTPDYQAIGSLGSATRDAYRNGLLIEAKRLKILDVAEGGDLFTGPWVVSIKQGENGEVVKGNLALEATGTETVSRNRKGVVVTRRDGAVVTRKTTKKDGVALRGESALELASVKRQKATLKAAQLSAQGQKGKAEAEALREQAQRDFLRAQEELRGNAEIGFTIVDLLNAVKEARGAGSNNNQIEAGSTANILRLLENKKASFGPQLPGYYRYFSSSHPSEEHQAPLQIGASVDGSGTPKLELVPGRIDETDVNMVFSEGGGDSVYYSTGPVTKGLLTRTEYSNDFSLIPTKDILTLCFQKHGTLKEVTSTTSSAKAGGWGEGNKFWSGFFANLKAHITKIIQKNKGTINNRTLSDMLFVSNWGTAYFNSAITDKVLPHDPAYAEGDNIALADVTTLVNSLRIKMVGYHRGTKPNYYTAEYDEVQAIEGTLKDLRTTFKQADLFFPSASVSKKSGTKTVWSKDTFVSPIFPISDENGYEVVGSYQYGRGLNVARGGSFDQLLVQDPTQIFSAKELTSWVKENPTNRGKAFAEKLRKLEEIGRGDLIDKIATSRGLRRGDLTGEGVSDEVMNKVMTTLDEQVITNVPQRMAEINPPSRGDAMCKCRAQNTDLEILALASDPSNFVSVGNAVTTEMDIVNNVAGQMASREQDYRTHQATLRHRLNESGSVASLNKVGEALSNIGEAIEEDYDRLVSDVTATGGQMVRSFDEAVNAAEVVGKTDKEKQDAAKARRRG